MSCIRLHCSCRMPEEEGEKDGSFNVNHAEQLQDTHLSFNSSVCRSCLEAGEAPGGWAKSKSAVYVVFVCISQIVWTTVHSLTLDPVKLRHVENSENHAGHLDQHCQAQQKHVKRK